MATRAQLFELFLREASQNLEQGKFWSNPGRKGGHKTANFTGVGPSWHETHRQILGREGDSNKRGFQPSEANLEMEDFIDESVDWDDNFEQITKRSSRMPYKKAATIKAMEALEQMKGLEQQRNAGQLIDESQYEELAKQAGFNPDAQRSRGQQATEALQNLNDKDWRALTMFQPRAATDFEAFVNARPTTTGQHQAKYGHPRNVSTEEIQNWTRKHFFQKEVDRIKRQNPDAKIRRQAPDEMIKAWQAYNVLAGRLLKPGEIEKYINQAGDLKPGQIPEKAQGGKYIATHASIWTNTSRLGYSRATRN